MLMLDTQIALVTCHHTRGKGTIFRIGGGVLLQVASKSSSTITYIRCVENEVENPYQDAELPNGKAKDDCCSNHVSTQLHS